MIRWLKFFIVFVWKKKKLLLAVFALSALFFALRFPWGLLLEKTVRNIQKNSPPSLQTEFDDLKLKIFPPGIEFENLFINYKGRTFSVQSFGISMDLARWLAFKKAWRVQLLQEDSSLNIVFWKTEEVDEEMGSLDIYSVRGMAPSLNLKIFNDIFPGTKMSGLIRTDFDYEGSLEKIQSSSASWSLQGEDVHLSKIELKTPMGPLSFPSIRWKEGNLLFSLKDGELVFKNLQLGAPTDDFIVQMKGSGAVFYSYGRLRLDSYDIQLQMDVSKNFQMSLLDLMFAGYKEDKGNFYRYLLRMTGQGNQVPNMEKLEAF